MKKDLSILLIDRAKKEEENVVKDIFYKYGKKYGLIVFPPKNDDEECRIQVVFYNHSILSSLQEIFQIFIDYDMDDPADFFDFDLTEIEENVFYEMLESHYSISLHNLSEVEVL